MDHDETGCQAPDRPILCINNCGFFGSAATMNMCSKCHREMSLQQEQTKLAAASLENIVNGSSSSNEKETIAANSVDVHVNWVKPKIKDVHQPGASASGDTVEVKPKEHPTRCITCRKRVGLTGFTCRCGNLYCASHRYSDKHDCQFDYRSAARDAITKANPIVKAEKLDKI